MPTTRSTSPPRTTPSPGALIQPDTGAAAVGGTGPVPIDFPVGFPIDPSGLTGHLTVDHGSAASKVPLGSGAAPYDVDGEVDMRLFAEALEPLHTEPLANEPRYVDVHARLASHGSNQRSDEPSSGEERPHAKELGTHGRPNAGDMSDEGKKGDERSHPFTVREDDSRKDDRSVQEKPALRPTLQDRRGLDSADLGGGAPPQHPEVTRQPWDLHVVNDPFDRVPRADEVVRSEEVGPYWRVEQTRDGELYLEETTIDGDRTGRFRGHSGTSGAAAGGVGLVMR
jgi:hypothetical protein